MSKPLFQMLPKELEYTILEIVGGLEHRDNIACLKDDIHFKYVCNYLDKLPSFEWFEYITFEEACEYMETLTGCKCCKEHQLHRPTIQMFIEGFVPSYSTKPFNDKKCKCKCRHLSRSLCREYNDEIDEIDNMVEN